MGMLERLSDVRGTIEGKIVAVVLAILLVLPMASISAFANNGNSSEEPQTPLETTETVEAPADEPAPTQTTVLNETVVEEPAASPAPADTSYATIDEFFEAVDDVNEANEAFDGNDSTMLLEAIDKAILVYDDLSDVDKADPDVNGTYEGLKEFAAQLRSGDLNDGIVLAAQDVKIKVVVKSWIQPGYTGGYSSDFDSSKYSPVSSLTTKASASGGITLTSFDWSYTNSTLATFTATATASGSSSNKWRIELPTPDQLFGKISYTDYSYKSRAISSWYSDTIANPYSDTGAPTGCTIYLYIKNPSVPHVHSYAWTQTQAPTCTAKGTEAYKCSCGDYTNTREIAARGHAWPTNWTDGCTDHQNANCTEHVKVCTRCNGVLNGGTQTSAHAYPTGWTLVTAATTTAKGLEKKVCTTTGCGHTIYQDIDKLAVKTCVQTVTFGVHFTNDTKAGSTVMPTLADIPTDFKLEYSYTDVDGEHSGILTYASARKWLDSSNNDCPTLTWDNANQSLKVTVAEGTPVIITLKESNYRIGNDEGNFIWTGSLNAGGGKVEDGTGEVTVRYKTYDDNSQPYVFNYYKQPAYAVRWMDYDPDAGWKQLHKLDNVTAGSEKSWADVKADNQLNDPADYVEKGKTYEWNGKWTEEWNADKTLKTYRAVYVEKVITVVQYKDVKFSVQTTFKGLENDLADLPENFELQYTITNPAYPDWSASGVLKTTDLNCESAYNGGNGYKWVDVPVSIPADADPECAITFTAINAGVEGYVSGFATGGYSSALIEAKKVAYTNTGNNPNTNKSGFIWKNTNHDMSYFIAYAIPQVAVHTYYDKLEDGIPVVENGVKTVTEDAQYSGTTAWKSVRATEYKTYGGKTYIRVEQPAEDAKITLATVPLQHKYVRAVTVTWKDGYSAEPIIKIETIPNGGVLPANPADPTREGYVFAEWGEPETDVDGNITITATWKDDTNNNGTPDEEEYRTIIYTDGVEGKVIFEDQKSEKLFDGDTTPPFFGTPTRDGYTFVSWTPEVAATVNGDATYVAQWVPNKPTEDAIKNEMSGRLLIECVDNHKHDLLWTLGYDTPWVNRSAEVTKGEDEKYHWSSSINVDEWVELDSNWLKNNRDNIDYDHIKNAQTIEPLVASFTFNDETEKWSMDENLVITINGPQVNYIWQNYDVTQLYTTADSACKSAAPEFVGDTPQRPEDDDFTYEFSGWSEPTVDPETGDVIYTAEYTPTAKKKITVTWLDGYSPDGDNVIDTVTINEGETYTNPEDPTREGYSFTGWSEPVTDEENGNITITAQWEIIVEPTPVPGTEVPPVEPGPDVPAPVDPITVVTVPVIPVVPIPALALPTPLQGFVDAAVDFLQTPVLPLAGIADDETPLADIEDEETPMSAFDHPFCWVHYYIILGIIITAIYGGGVIARRLGYNHKIKKYDDDVTGKEKKKGLETEPADNKAQVTI